MKVAVGLSGGVDSALYRGDEVVGGGIIGTNRPVEASKREVRT